MSGGWGGAAEGARSGWDRGADFSRNYMGWGDYTSTNQIMGNSDGGDSQQQISVNPMNNTGDVYLSHTEFVQNVTATAGGAGSSTFSIVKFQLNPGLSATFPFLAQIAQNFELYDFEGLIFQFKPTSTNSSNTSNIGLGKVIMCTRYDPDSPDFINSVEMENYDYAQSAKPTCGMHHGVETAQSQQSVNMMYTRTGISNKSKVFTDIGSFFVATEGIPFAAAGTAVIGELWVSYRIRLSRAKLYSSQLGTNISTDYFQGLCGPLNAIANPVANVNNSIGTVISDVAANKLKITFPANINLGVYRVSIYTVGIDPAAFTDFQYETTLYNAANCDYYSIAGALNGTVSLSVPAPEDGGAATEKGASIEFYLRVNSPGVAQASVEVWMTQACQTPSYQYITITQANNAFAPVA